MLPIYDHGAMLIVAAVVPRAVALICLVIAIHSARTAPTESRTELTARR